MISLGSPYDEYIALDPHSFTCYKAKEIKNNKFILTNRSTRLTRNDRLLI